MKYAAYVLHLFVQFVGKEGGSKISHVHFHLGKQENEAQIRSSKQEKRDNKIREEINDMKIEGQQKVNKSKSCFFCYVGSTHCFLYPIPRAPPTTGSLGMLLLVPLLSHLHLLPEDGADVTNISYRAHQEPLPKSIDYMNNLWL